MNICYCVTELITNYVWNENIDIIGIYEKKERLRSVF